MTLVLGGPLTSDFCPDKMNRMAVSSLLTHSLLAHADNLAPMLGFLLSVSILVSDHCLARSLITASERHAYAAWQSYKLRETETGG